MPPLERLQHQASYSPPAPSTADKRERYISIHDNRIYRDVNNQDVFSRAPLPESSEYIVLAQRDVIVAKSPIYEIPSEDDTSKSSKDPFLSNMLDFFTTLCVCKETSITRKRKKNPATKSMTGQQRQQSPDIVYPVARYPARLNSPEMVKQRRKSLQKHLTFRPVVCE